MRGTSERFILWFKKPWVTALLLSAATFLLFSPAIGYDFINYDDGLYAKDNAYVQHGLTWAGLSYAARTIDGVSWMPATWISLMLDTSLYGTRPAGYHLTNILLHAASAGLLFYALQRMTRRFWPALLVAALFALHPQRAESVVWISERKDVLSLFFCMSGLLAYARYAEQPGRGKMFLVAVCLTLGLMAKPMVVSFPLMLLLLDFWPLQRTGGSGAELRAKIWPLIREKIPLFLISATAMVATVWSQGNKHGLTTVHFAWYLKLFRVIEDIGFYCKSFLYPDGLSLLYRTAPLNFVHVTLVGLVLLGITVLAFQKARRWPWLVVGWLWFLITLAPVSGIIRIGDITVADRYSYLPSIGLALVVVYAIVEMMARWPRARSVPAGALVAGITLLSGATWVDLPRWRDNFSIFESAYRHGAHFAACDQLGAMLFARQEYKEAIVVCTRGLDSELPSLYSIRGHAYYQLGDLDHALADFNHAIEFNPAFSDAYYCRALVHLQRKQFTEAKADLEAYHQTGGTLDTSALLAPPPPER